MAKSGPDLDQSPGISNNPDTSADGTDNASIGHMCKKELLENHRSEESSAIETDRQKRTGIERQVTKLTSDPGFASASLEERMDRIVSILNENRDYLDSAPAMRAEILQRLVGSERELIQNLDQQATPILEERASLLALPEHARPWDYESKLEQSSLALNELLSSVNEVVGGDAASEQALKDRMQRKEDELRAREVLRHTFEMQRQAVMFSNTPRETIAVERVTNYLEKQAAFLDRNPIVRESLEDHRRQATQAGESWREIYEKKFQDLATEMGRGWIRRDPDAVRALLSGSDQVQLRYFTERYRMQTGEVFGQVIHDRFGKYDAVQEAYRNAQEVETRYLFSLNMDAVDRAFASQSDSISLYSSRDIGAELSTALESADPALSLLVFGQSLSPVERMQAFEDFEARNGVKLHDVMANVLSTEDLPLVMEYLNRGVVSTETAELHYGMKLGSLEGMQLGLSMLDPENSQRQERFKEVAAERMSQYAVVLGLSENQLERASENVSVMLEEVRTALTLSEDLTEGEISAVNENRDIVEFMVLQEEARIFTEIGEYDVVRETLREYIENGSRFQEEARILNEIVDSIEFIGLRGTTQDPRYQLVQDLREEARELAERQRNYAGGASRNADRFHQDAVDSTRNWAMGEGFWATHSGSTQAMLDTANAEASSAAARWGNYREIERAITESMEHSQRFLALEAEADTLEAQGQTEAAEESREAAHQAFLASLRALEGQQIVHESVESINKMQQARHALNEAIENIDTYDRRLRTARKCVVFAGAAIATGGLALGVGGGAAGASAVGGLSVKGGLLASTSAGGMGILKGSIVSLGGGMAAGTGIWTVGTAAEHGTRAVQGDISFREAGLEVIRDLPEGMYTAAQGSAVGLAAAGGGAFMATRFAGSKISSTVLGRGLVQGLGSGVAGGTTITAFSIAEREHHYRSNLAGWEREQGREFTAEERSEIRQAMGISPGAIAMEWGVNAGTFFVFSGIGSTAGQMRAGVASNGVRGTLTRGAVTTGEAATSGGIGVAIGGTGADNLVQEGANVVTYDLLGNMLGRRMPGGALRAVAGSTHSLSRADISSPISGQAASPQPARSQENVASVDVSPPLRLTTSDDVAPVSNNRVTEGPLRFEIPETSATQRQASSEASPQRQADAEVAQQEGPVLERVATPTASESAVRSEAQSTQRQNTSSGEGSARTAEGNAPSRRLTHSSWHAFRQKAAVAVLTASTMFSTLAPSTARASDGPMNQGNNIVQVDNGLNRSSAPDAPQRAPAPDAPAPYRAPAPEAPRAVESNQVRAESQSSRVQLERVEQGQRQAVETKAETRAEVNSSRTDQGSRVSENQSQQAVRALDVINFRNHADQQQRSNNENLNRLLDDARKQNKPKPNSFRLPRGGGGEDSNSPGKLRVDGSEKEESTQKLKELQAAEYERNRNFKKETEIEFDAEGNYKGVRSVIKAEGG